MEGHGIDKFKDAGLIATSANRAWSLLSAELRNHKLGEIGAFTPQNAEITQTIRDTNCAYSVRTSGGVRQQVVAIPGTIWLCPAGIREEATRLSGDMPEVLHVYLPPHSFLGIADENQTDFRAQDLRYQSRVTNPVVLNITSNIVRELRAETSSGGLKMDALAIELIETLARDHAEITSSRPPVAFAKGALDRRRLDRVLQYIEANMDADISVADLAHAACFSLCHFVRAFHLAMGRPPHAYLSERRLDRAKHLLAHSNTPLVEISLSCRFSGQANFTKAFTRAMGASPGRYRKACR
ncbi:MAG TPA: AraC family transcriptional regulator [Rhodanobacteraceae bacterium]|nr:AraC family transcriptional regulator [Rhodanobacteraceae bacterium]